MKGYPKYKDSGVEWLGAVPEHWAVCRNTTFLKEKTALSKDGKEQLLSVSEYYGVRPTAEKKTSDEYLSRAESLVGYRLVKHDELVMNYMLAWKGALGASKFDGIVSPAYSVFQFRKDMSPDYFHYLWRTPVASSEFKRLSTGIIESRLRLYPDVFLKEIHSTCPPLDEQRAIAAYLDRETAKIDNLIAKQEQLIALIDEKRQALISHAVTKGIDSLRCHGFKPVATKMKDSGIEWLGQVPAHWEVKRLKHLLKKSLMYGANEAALSDNPADPRFIRITDIADDNTLREDTFKSLSPELAQPYLLEDEDILLVRSGATVGKSFLYRTEWGGACFAGYLIKVSVRRQVLSAQYLNFCLHSKYYWAFILGSQIQATIQNVSGEKYTQLPVALPPLSEQRAIAAYLDRETAKIDTLKAKAQSAIDLLKEKRSALISAAVTGKIDVRESLPRDL